MSILPKKLHDSHGEGGGEASPTSLYVYTSGYLLITVISITQPVD